MLLVSEIKLFRERHMTFVNRLGHCLAALMLTFAFLMFTRGSVIGATVRLYVLAFLLFACPPKMVAVLLVGSAVICSMAQKISFEPNGVQCILIATLAIVLTECFHVISGEATYRSTYANVTTGKWLSKMIAHNLLLVPLIIDACIDRPLWSSHHISLKDDTVKPILELADRAKTSKRFTNIPYHAQQDIDISSVVKLHAGNNALFRYVPSMDEIYISDPSYPANGLATNSEAFHIDGHVPNLWGCRTYRVLISISDPSWDKSKTDFLLERNRQHGDNVLIFDYNAEVHRALLDHGNHPVAVDATKRVLLKRHVITFPRWMPSWYVDVYTWVIEWIHHRMRASQESDDSRVQEENRCSSLTMRIVRLLSTWNVHAMRHTSIQPVHTTT